MLNGADEIEGITPEILEKINALSAGMLTKKQDDSKASLVTKTTKEDGKIDWSQKAIHIERQFRAMNPWPGIWTTWNNKILKILEIEVTQNNDIGKEAGTVFLDLDDFLAVASGENTSMKVLKLQLEGKKSLDYKSFLLGQSEILNSILK